ncbi:MAG TPA: DUF6691 family protein [Microvirga sp.]|nr:DUF6691 family protein [Microvirga sp.]
MNRAAAALLSGTVFGLGLAVSGMVNPAKVLAFLDIAGRWDPSLALVMAGALAVAFVGFRLVLRRRAPLFAGRFELPSAREIDARLLGGAALFGIGWGLVGFCPGPAIASLAFAWKEPLIFLAAMLAGAWLYRASARARPPATSAASPGA